MTKDLLVQIRVDEIDVERLDYLAAQWETSRSATIRRLLKERTKNVDPKVLKGGPR